jgi:spore germination cell wall hydrolase CwlJ-like protein
MNNWYKISKINKELSIIQKEAGLKQNLTISLMMAYVAVMTGSAIWNAAKKYNVSEQQIQTAINTPELQKAFSDGKFNNIIKYKDYFTSEDNLILDPIQTPSFNKGDLKENDPKEIKTNNNDEKETRENLSPLEVIARTIYDEARGEGNDGMHNVGQVIANRSNGSPQSLKSVCLKPWQFSGWNNNRIIPRGSGKEWDYSIQLAQRIINGEISPNSQGYKFFCNPNVVLSQKGIKSHKLSSFDDLKRLPKSSLLALPTFMFYPQRQNKTGGGWKNIYPKTHENLRKDSTVIGNHFFYP